MAETVKVTFEVWARTTDRTLIHVYADGERLGTIAPKHVTWEQMRAMGFEVFYGTVKL